VLFILSIACVTALVSACGNDIVLSCFALQDTQMDIQVLYSQSEVTENKEPRIPSNFFLVVHISCVHHMAALVASRFSAMQCRYPSHRNCFCFRMSSSLIFPVFVTLFHSICNFVFRVLQKKSSGFRGNPPDNFGFVNGVALNIYIYICSKCLNVCLNKRKLHKVK